MRKTLAFLLSTVLLLASSGQFVCAEQFISTRQFAVGARPTQVTLPLAAQSPAFMGRTLSALPTGLLDSASGTLGAYRPQWTGISLMAQPALAQAAAAARSVAGVFATAFSAASVAETQRAAQQAASQTGVVLALTQTAAAGLGALKRNDALGALGRGAAVSLNSGLGAQRSLYDGDVTGRPFSRYGNDVSVTGSMGFHPAVSPTGRLHDKTGLETHSDSDVVAADAPLQWVTILGGVTPLRNLVRFLFEAVGAGSWVRSEPYAIVEKGAVPLAQRYSGMIGKRVEVVVYYRQPKTIPGYYTWEKNLGAAILFDAAPFEVMYTKVWHPAWKKGIKVRMATAQDAYRFHVYATEDSEHVTGQLVDIDEYHGILGVLLDNGRYQRHVGILIQGDPEYQRFVLMRSLS